MKIKRTDSYYSPAQVAQYLQHVTKSTNTNDAALDLTPQDIQEGAFPCTLENLALLVRLHLLTFPFEDTAMHYTAERTMDVSREGVFNRLVLAGKGLGSYCFGHNTLLLGILRGLGYRAISIPGRVNNALTRPGFSQISLSIQSHMVLLVQSDLFAATDDQSSPQSSSSTYVVDVGFGGYVPVRPVPLLPNAVVPGSAPPEEFRLVRGYHPNSSLEFDHSKSNTNTNMDSSPTLLHHPDWILQVRNGSDIADWRDAYHFSIVETFPEDHEAWNYTLHRANDGPGGAPFWNTVIVVKHFVVDGEDGKDERVRLGKVYAVGGQVLRRVGDQRERVAVLKDELDRVRALKKYVGIEIPEEDVVHIKGRASALAAS